MFPRNLSLAKIEALLSGKTCEENEAEAQTRLRTEVIQQTEQYRTYWCWLCCPVKSDEQEDLESVGQRQS
jgi:hypothetical protein